VAVRQILIDGGTHAELSGRFALEPLGEVLFKGKSAPVLVFAVQHAGPAR
jgi:class 3 adenylate cyclase